MLTAAQLPLEEHSASLRRLQGELRQLEIEKEVAQKNEQRTISLLVSEKSSLMAEVQRLADVDSSKRSKVSLISRVNGCNQNSILWKMFVQRRAES